MSRSYQDMMDDVECWRRAKYPTVAVERYRAAAEEIKELTRQLALCYDLATGRCGGITCKDSSIPAIVAVGDIRTTVEGQKDELAQQEKEAEEQQASLRSAWAERDALRVEVAKLRALDAEAATYVESVICMRTGFTGEPPYVGWKGLGLALKEALDERDAALANEGAMQRRLTDVLADSQVMQEELDTTRARACGWRDEVEALKHDLSNAYMGRDIARHDAELAAAEVAALRELLAEARPYIWWSGTRKGMHVGGPPNDRFKNDKFCAAIDAALANKQQDHQQPISSAEETAAIKAALSNGPPSDEERAMIERGLL